MKAIAVLSLAALLAGSQLRAQTPALSQPLGIHRVTCLPNSDTVCAVPFTNTVAYRGALNAAPNVASGVATLTPTVATGWAANGFAGLHYVRFVSGARSGSYYQITANSTGDVTIDLAGDNLSGVTAGDRFKICKFWTLGTLFPPSTQTTFVPSLGTTNTQRRSSLRPSNNITVGTNLSPLESFYIVGSNWLRVGGGTTPVNDTIIWPDSYFEVRHNHSTITASTTFTSAGGAELTDFSTPLATRTTGQQDNQLTNGRPIPVRLADLDLGTTVFINSLGTSSAQRRDQLLVYNNAVADLNRSASATYYRVGTNWYRTGDGTVLHNNDTIAAGVGFVIRKYQTSNGATVSWTNNPY